MVKTIHNWVMQYEWRQTVTIFLAKWALPIIATLAVILRYDELGFVSALTLVMVGLGVWSLNQVIGLLVNQPRPFVTHKTIQALFPPSMSWKSFPSDHAALAAVAAFGVWSLYPVLGWIFLVFAVLIGLSRVGAGLHFTKDIIGGLAIGWLLSWATNLF